MKSGRLGKRILSCFLVFALMVGLVPTAAFAAEPEISAAEEQELQSAFEGDVVFVGESAEELIGEEIGPSEALADEDPSADAEEYEDLNVSLQELEYAALGGRVTDSQGSGISGASVFIYDVTNDEAMDTCLTDSSGRWSCADTEAGMRYAVSYYHRDYDLPADEQLCTVFSGGTTLPTVSGARLLETPAESASADFAYTVINGLYIEITEYSGSDTFVVVPETIDGYTVQSIGSNVFYGRTDITGIYLPDGVTKIGSYAFRDCTALKDVYLNAGLTSVGYQAFRNCKALTDLRLPNTLAVIDTEAFRGCTGLTALTLPDSVTTLSGSVFYDCAALTAVTYPRSWVSSGASNFSGTGVTAIAVPEGITSIPAYAFCDSELSSVSLPSTLKKIGSGAFRSCAGLTAVTLPEGTAEIGDGAFRGCTGLTTVTLPSTLTTIGGEAFRDCTGLTTVTLPSTLTTIGGEAFRDCTGLTAMTLPNSVTSMEYGAFQDCANLAAINYPTGWTSAGTGIFTGCTALRSITVPEGVTAIPDYAFQDSELTSVSLPSTLTTIGSSAFRACEGLTAIDLPAGLKTLKSNAFQNCTGLRAITLPDGMTTIQDEVFRGCTALTTVTFPKELTAIGYQAFRDCTALTMVTLPDTVTGMESGAFQGCTSLSSINYPTGWASAGTGIFSGCGKLRSITVPEGVITIPAYAFYGSSLRTMRLPASVTAIGSYAFRACGELEKIWVGEEVESIGDDAFRDCALLTMYGVSGSYAETYAASNSIPFLAESFEASAGTLGGQVTANGTGIPGVSVFLYDVTADMPLNTCRTGVDGTWSSTEAEAGSTYAVSYYHRDYTLSQAEHLCVATAEGVTLPAVTGSRLLAAPAESDPDDFAYEIINGLYIRITAYSGSDTFVVIPETIDGYTVQAIGSSVFYGRTDITGIYLPDGITEIGSYAFRDCTALKDVYLNAGLTSVGYQAFRNCKALTDLRLPNTLAVIDTEAFRGCTGLTALTLPDSVTTLSGSVFYDCAALTAVTYPRSWVSSGASNFSGTGVTAIAVPEGITSIPAYAFYDSELSSVSLPSTLKKIGNGAFRSCAGLTAVTVPEGTAEIGDGAFRGCTGLTTVTLPSTLTTIGGEAFRDCTGLTAMTLPNSVTSMEYGAFQNCANLSSINYPTGWTTAGSGIFEGCTALLDMTVPEGVTAIPAYAFHGSELQRVTLPSTLETIGVHAFRGCAGLTAVSVPEGVTEIGDGAFRDCAGLRSVTLPSTLKHLESDAFRSCTALTAVTLPESIVEIGNAAFRDCTNLSSINYPVNWSESGGDVFMGCTKLRTITIPQGVTTIPAYAFRGSSLRNVQLPDSVTAIGSYAFAACEELRFIYLPQSASDLGDDIFKNSSRVVIHCEFNSLSTIYAIEYGIPFVATETLGLPDDGILDRTSTNYVAQTGGAAANGYVTMTMDLTVDETVWEKAYAREVVLSVPSVITLEESSIKLDGVLCTTYDYDVTANTLTIPLTDRTAEVKFSGRVTEPGNIESYALFTCAHRERGSLRSVVGIISEEMGAFTLSAPELTSSTVIRVEGVAPRSAAVSLYVNGTLAASTTANKAGTYGCDVSLGDVKRDTTFVISGSCSGTAGELLSASQNTSYQVGAPEMTGFKFYVDGKDSGMVDLYELAQQGITPAITHTGSRYPYKFVINFRNPQSIDKIYVTSVRSNVKKFIEATYDATLDAFVAIGHFDETNGLYVPGRLAVEYNLKQEETLVSGAEHTVDWETYENLLHEDLREKTKVTRQDTASGSTGTLDFSNVSSDLVGFGMDYTIKTVDLLRDTDFDSLWGLAQTEANLFSYILPGENNSRYYAMLDLRDPSTYTMFVSDGLDAASKVYELKLSMADFGSAGYGDLFDLSTRLSEYSTYAGVIHKSVGFYMDNQKLRDEIMQSSTITDKHEALEKADELMYDQIAFTLLTTALPLLVAGGPMSGATLMFSAMIGIIGLMSTFFWENRIFQIKGGIFGIKWHIDPSGYVYDLETLQRLPGVTTTAYCVEFDVETDDDSFWDAPPADTEYGTVWNAAEYSQMNPLTTDADGRYAWDVPEGWWRVKYEKAGYVTTWSEWLPVPPPQTEVNIGMMPLSEDAWELALKSGSASAATVSLTFGGAAAVTANLLMATYDGDERMVSRKLVSETLEPQETLDLSLSYAGEDAETVRVFILSESGFTPLRDVWTARITG